MSAASKEPFPRVFVVANVIELFERLAFYGVYINLSFYLINDVGLTATENGTVLGLFALARSWLPVGIGAVADRLTFRRSLLIAFTLYSLAYGALFLAPTRPLAYLSLFGMAIGGAFMKPVITGCVRRYSPEGRQTQGFAIFYATVNAGSVVGKVAAKLVRTAVSLRATMLTSIGASLVALAMTALLFFEPTKKDEPKAGAEPAPQESSKGTLAAYGDALKNARLSVFLLLVSGYYLLIEQFYQTFPIYMARLMPDAPREYVSLVNPASIALLQVVIARATKPLSPLTSMATGIGIGSVSMVAMGMFPNLYGAVGSFFLFAVAEMVFSPRYYDFVSSFAPKGREGLYMGLALAPFGVGGLVGGVLSGRLVERFLPEHGDKNPLAVWGTYAVIGVLCALALALYAKLAGKREPEAV